MQPKAEKAAPDGEAAPAPDTSAEKPSSETQAADDKADQAAEAQRTAETVARELEAVKELIGEKDAAQLREFMQRAAEFEAEQNSSAHSTCSYQRCCHVAHSCINPMSQHI